jgi:putative nucleotidyltransferase with HDIG domain
MDNPLQATKNFVKEYLNPQPDRYDMTYRFEHSLRVARWGKKIAEGEGWNPEPLVMACLLHDVGYPLCKDFADLKNHPRYSVEIAEKFLKQIGYDETLSKSMCICDNRLKQIEDSYNRKCGTKTAQNFWEEELVKRKKFYEELKLQMEETFKEI